MSKILSAEERVKTGFLIEKINKQKIYSEKLGLEDMSRFHGKRIKGGN